MDWIAFVSMCWAYIGSAVNVAALWELRRSESGFTETWRALAAGAAAMSFTYANCYAWLVFGSPDRAEWSEVLAYVALFGWPVVWIVPGWALWYATRSGRRMTGGGDVS